MKEGYNVVSITDSIIDRSFSITSDDDISERRILSAVLFSDTELGLNVVKIIPTTVGSDQCDINILLDHETFELVNQ